MSQCLIHCYDTHYFSLKLIRTTTKLHWMRKLKLLIRKVKTLGGCSWHSMQGYAFWPTPGSTEGIFESSGFPAEETLLSASTVPHCEVYPRSLKKLLYASDSQPLTSCEQQDRYTQAADGGEVANEEWLLLLKVRDDRQAHQGSQVDWPVKPVEETQCRLLALMCHLM